MKLFNYEGGQATVFITLVQFNVLGTGFFWGEMSNMITSVRINVITKILDILNKCSYIKYDSWDSK